MRTRFQAAASVCSVCLGPVQVRGVVDCCRHEFCFSCIEDWAKVNSMQRKNTCPVCKLRFLSIEKVPQRRVYTGRKTREKEVVYIASDLRRTDMRVEEVMALLATASHLVSSEFEVLQRSLHSLGLPFSL